MSHLTAADIKTVGQMLDSAIAFASFMGEKGDPDASRFAIILQGLKLFMPMFSLEMAEECSFKYYQEGKITLQDREKIKQLVQTKPAKHLMLKGK